MLESGLFFVVLNGKKSRWQQQRNGLPQGSVLLHYRSALHPETRSFIYADDLCITSQEKDFHNIEARLTSVLNTLTPYCELNQLCPNPSKTQVCAFRLRKRNAKRELNVVWNETRLINTATPVYLGIHLDRTLSYKVHIQKIQMKVSARNNRIRKLQIQSGVQSVNTKNKLYRTLLLGCRIRLFCLGKE